jgi:hypothetical protein
MNNWRNSPIPYIVPEDIRYYLVSLPAEQLSFLVSSEAQIDEASIKNIIS